MSYDLHTHTTASDGIQTPDEVITAALKIGLSGLAITDHDTVDGLEPARQFILRNSLEIELIPGIELNTDYGDNEVHILGYYIDAENEHLISRLADIRQQRLQRAQKIITQLQGMGLPIEWQRVQELAHGDLIGRPHIARALQERGYVASEAEAFHRYIGKGRSAYVPRYKFTPAEAIGLIKDAGGIAVLAHPGLIREPIVIQEIIELGVEGLEVYYPEHSPEQIIEFKELARLNGLLVTGGSDYHGPGTSEKRSQLGLSYLDDGEMNRIRNFLKE